MGSLWLQRAGPRSGWATWAPHCPGFSWRGHGLGRRTQYLWLLGSVALRHLGSSQIRDRAVSPTLTSRFFTTESAGKPSL